MTAADKPARIPSTHDASQRSSHIRNPCRESHLFNIKVEDISQIERQEGYKHPPDRIQEETSQDDRPVLSFAQQLAPGLGMSIDLRLFLGLITQDVMALLFRNPWMLLRTLLVDDEPWNEPQQAQRTYADKGDLPTEADKQHQDEYRSNDATNGGCRTEKALRKSTLLLWKPFCIALCRARPRSCLAQSEHHAESRERELTRRECSQSICQSPYQHATKESLTAAHLVI